MEDKQLRKLSKKELLEVLLSQAKRIEELELDLERVNKKLLSRKISIENAGSLAEASLKLNNVFEDAEQAAKQYLENVKDKCRKMELKVKKDAELEAKNLLKQTTKVCKKKEEEVNKKLAELELRINRLNNSKNSSSKNTKKSKNVKVKLEKMIKEV